MKYSRKMRLYFMLMATSTILGAQAQQPFDLDSTFRTSLGSRNVNSMAIMPDGRLLISGRLKFNGVVDEWPLARLLSNGSLDPSWNFGAPGGSKITPWSSGYYVGTTSLVRRLDAAGQLDPSFILMTNSPYFSPGQGGDYHVYPDGRVLMTGVHVLSDSIRGFEGFYSLVWFSNTGYLDTTATHRKCDGSIDFIHPLPDGKFLLSGIFTTYEGQPAGRIFRVHPDGGLDTSFSTNIYWGQAYGCHLLDDGRILAAGRFLMNGDPDTLHLIRLFPDGALDSTFNNHLRSSYHQYGGFFSWSGITSVSPLGHIVYGAFTSIDEQPRGGIALVDTSGVLLNTYFSGTGCGVYEYMGFPYSSVESLIPDPVGGGYYICGAYTGYDDGTTNDPQQRFVSRLYGLDVEVREVPVKEPGASLGIHPNPASTHSTFHYTLPSEVEAAHLVVMDAHGKRLDQLRATPPMGQLIWDTRKVPPGVYIVELLGTSGSLVRDRFVVQP